MKSEIKYYNIDDDIKEYPDCWCYVTVGGRSTGKTYGALKSCLETGRHFLFVKRTIEDVTMLCDTDRGQMLSPFKPINRDKGTDIKSKLIAKGFGGFFDGDDVIGYIGALSGIGKFTGFDLSDCDWVIFDEFIPRKWDRYLQAEGTQLLDLYMTVNRDRELQGREPVKLILLANSVSLSSPVTDTLEITDDLADMATTGAEFKELTDRGILLHILKDNDVSARLKDTAFYKAVKDTVYGSMAFDNDFSMDDLTRVRGQRLKGYICKAAIRYQGHDYYIYKRGKQWHITRSKQRTDNYYNLDLETDQRRFYIDYAIDLKNATIDGLCTYDYYSVYSLILNYSRKYRIR